MQRYSLLSLVAHALRGNKGWQPAWREAEPRPSYDVIVVGGGGHGLATAYNLAKRHGVRRVAVLEKGWIGGGNSGRNTQVIRSNYFFPATSAFYEHSLKLYESLTHELNFNVMLSQRGLLVLAHSQHELGTLERWASAIQLNGVDVELVSREQILRIEPLLNVDCRYPVAGGYFQPRAGIARHDGVVWGFARAASALGVDIVQNCEVTGFDLSGGRIRGVRTTRGRIATDRVALCVAGSSSVLAQQAGIQLPMMTVALQAMVTEPVKPALNSVVLSGAIHAYASQSDRGEIVIGGSSDLMHSYAQRGGLPAMRTTVAAILELFPSLSRLRLMRQWAGGIDVTPDMSPIMGLTPVSGLFISCGWGTGGFKAIPAGGEAMAYTVANDAPHPLVAPFSLERFSRGALINERAAVGAAH